MHDFREVQDQEDKQPQDVQEEQGHEGDLAVGATSCDKHKYRRERERESAVEVEGAMNTFRFVHYIHVAEDPVIQAFIGWVTLAFGANINEGRDQYRPDTAH